MGSALYILFTSLPIHAAAFALLWNYQWRSKALAGVLAAVNVLLKLIVIGYALRAGRGMQLVEALISLLGASIYFFCVRVDFFKLLFTYTLLVDYLLVVRGISSFVGLELFEASQCWQSGLLGMLLYLVSFPLLARFFKGVSMLISRNDTQLMWRVIWIPPALTGVIVIYCTNTFSGSGDSSWTLLLIRLCLLASVIAVCLLLLQAVDHLRRQAFLEERDRQNQRILTLQRCQYASIQSHMEEVRRARHDLRQHQNIIQAYLDSGDEQSLREYISSMRLSQPVNDFRTYCSLSAVNTLFNHYATLFQNHGVDYEFELALPEYASDAESDLCVLFGNLLENAFEACAGQTAPRVRAAARATCGGAITIVVDNTAPEPPRFGPDGAILSTKHEGGGIGIQSVCYIARHYDGTADFKWQNGMFLASVFINLPGALTRRRE